MHTEELRPASRLRTLTDEDLMSMIKSGDQAAFAELHRRYLPRLDGFLSRFIRDPEERRDIIQETFIRVHLAADRYTDVARCSTWIHTIAMNLARTFHRRDARWVRLSMDEGSGYDGRLSGFDEPLDSDPDPAELLQLSWDLDCTLEKLAKMRPEYSTAILLRDFLECSYQDIARHTGETMGTVKSRINRARAILREGLSVADQPADRSVQS